MLVYKKTRLVFSNEQEMQLSEYIKTSSDIYFDIYILYIDIYIYYKSETKPI